MIFGWSKPAAQLDGQAYDWLFSSTQTTPAGMAPRSTLLGIDEATLIAIGGARNLRQTLADVLPKLCAAKPLALAVDLMLSTAEDPAIDEALGAALAKCPSVVLGADIIRQESIWEQPVDIFRQASAAIGHVHADPDPVSRHIPLEKAVSGQRYWALALEAYRLSKLAGPILETPEDLELGSLRIPAPRSTARSLYVNYLPEAIPQVSLKQLLDKPETALQFSGKVAFLGYTDQSAARDRLLTPRGTLMTGVEIHANLFETLNSGLFITEAPLSAPVLLTLLAVALPGIIFLYLSGAWAWALAAVWLLFVHSLPRLFFANLVFLPPSMLLAGVWLATLSAASFHYFVIRRQWQQSEADKTRYQQAIHFVTHEMKTPLTAIQGSSEIMTRYKLNEEKQKQIAQMIHSESRRLASMIQTFLDVERLAEGEMQLKSDSFSPTAALLPALDRARILAERKEMTLSVGPIPGGELRGDRELLEYAFYNLLNNAVKYSPERTQIDCECATKDNELFISIRDRGMGMDATDLKRIFERFYRSRRAESSGISGTGIGLSIVNEIIRQHRGRIEVQSEVGVGSVFTVILPFVPAPSLDSDIANAPQRTTSAG